ncbi:L-fucose/L-arabinose isomerase family protein [Capillimicrobium parvum]|uniref:FucIase n=1 Tax=Capillimicrobium parvum TaxID=2884022 RepID=A0A9E6XTU3_9ACTN|nr:L-fucose/L-arabinose isomerase family protein [Capillimicrobium parvum]UGS34060.1 L-fucose isomerase [Capillimicrobium parvum]
MTTIGLLTVSDGRPSVQADIGDFVADSEQRLAGALTDRGFSVVRASEIVGSNDVAVREARRIAAARPDLTLINIPVWAFPHFTMLAASETASPLALFSNLDPKYPGMVGMLAAGGALDQIGRVHARAWGDSGEPEAIDGLATIARAGAASAGLRGSTFGRIGGRPMGMYTAVSNPDQWMREFGVDVEEIDQFELVRRAETIDPALARHGREWLERLAAGVHYDGRLLTPELLERQVRVYEAMRELIAERNLDFCGIKAQPELTDHYCTTDIAEAFLNDPYDWHGPKTPVVCSTEADMDAALTMQLLRNLSGTPVLFADVRHYHADRGIWDLCNSGQHATWFAARSAEPAQNLAHVHLYPEDFYFPAGGASVHYLAAEGDMTFARLTRLDGDYRMQVMRGAFERYDDDTNERLMRQSTYVWPHAFARMEAGPEEILTRFGSNHIHAVPGDHVASLRHVCQFLGIAFDGFGGA